MVSDRMQSEAKRLEDDINICSRAQDPHTYASFLLFFLEETFPPSNWRGNEVTKA